MYPYGSIWSHMYPYGTHNCLFLWQPLDMKDVDMKYRLDDSKPKNKLNKTNGTGLRDQHKLTKMVYRKDRKVMEVITISCAFTWKI